VPDQIIGNDVFSIKFDSSIDLSETSNESIPLFGAKYHFKLDDLVDCPEYLVYFPLLEKYVRLIQYSLLSHFNRLAEKHGLEVVDRQTFKDFFNQNKDSSDGRFLLEKMNALQVKRISLLTKNTTYNLVLCSSI
jgi:mRNA (guanine-N7-)-methyltransferase